MLTLTETCMTALLDEFRAYLRERRHLAERTIQRYAETTERLATFLVEGTLATDLTDVTAEHIEAFLVDEAKRAPAKASWNTRLTAVRAFYAFLVKTDRLRFDPARKVERIRGPVKEPIPLSFEEMLRLSDAVEEGPDAYRARNLAIIHVFFHCAVRVAELVSLNVDQVDFERRAFLGVRAKYDKELVLPFNDLVSEHLEAYLEERTKRGTDASSGPLFLSDRGSRLSIRAVQDFLSRYGKHAGIERAVTPHLLRHASATEHAAGGVPLTVIQSMLGHRSAKTTERYVHTNGSQRRAASDALGQRWRDRARARGTNTERPPSEVH